MRYVDYGIAKEKLHIQPVSLDAIYYVMGDNKSFIPHKVIAEEQILIVSISGYGIIRTKEDEIQLDPGKFLVLDAAQENFRYHCEDNNWNFWWFEFRCLDSDFGKFPLDIPQPAKLNDKAFYLCEESLKHLKAEDVRTASCLFSALLCLLLKECREVSETQHNMRLFRKAEHYVMDNLATATVKSTAKYLNVSERTLLNLFQSMQGIRTIEYIQNKRIDEACRLLAVEQKTISEIAEELGYADQFVFSKAFGKHMGMCPSEYRKQFV